MAVTFVSEAMEPLEFSAAGMAGGEPGLPGRFRWRRREYAVGEIVERWKEFGDCRNGSGERYLRRHVWRIRTVDGTIFRISFQRTSGRTKLPASRWWIHSIETP